MKLRALLFAVLATSSCEAILDLHDRVLRDAGSDVVVADAACDGEQCSCGHAFCDNFDSYKTVQDIQQRWSVPGFQNSILQLGGTVTLDNSGTIPPPSSPNALLTTVSLPIELQGAGFIMTQVDASTASVAGIHVAFSLRVVGIDPADGAPPLLDSGAMMFGGILALVDFTSKNGVGIALTEQGGYVGYALDVLQAGSRLAQGKQFYFDSPNTLNQLNQYVPIEVYVAKRSAITLPVECTQGPVLTDVDGDIPDAALPTDPVVVVVTSAFSQPACEIVGGDLAFPTWLSTPLVVLGSVVKGQGLFSVEYDNFTLDFL
ncbi:MAG TPA: hypothetical protein VH142_00845 [Polyangiaceae bacterium]|nr:hypothetical protein [Polyangiaceae bacterium]